MNCGPAAQAGAWEPGLHHCFVPLMEAVGCATPSQQPGRTPRWRQVHKAQGKPASQPLVPEGAKFNFAFTFEKAGVGAGYPGLHFVYGSLHMEFEHELRADNATYCLCLKVNLGSKRIPF